MGNAQKKRRARREIMNCCESFQNQNYIFIKEKTLSYDSRSMIKMKEEARGVMRYIKGGPDTNYVYWIMIKVLEMQKVLA